MIFSSSSFAVFFLFVFLVQWYIIPYIIPEKYRLRSLHLFLLSASYFFYMSWEWQFGFLIAFSTIIDYIAGIWMHRADESYPEEQARRIRKTALWISMIVNLGVLSYFKYVDFFIDSFVDFSNMLVPGAFSSRERYDLLLNVILPLGISFFTFQSMSYTIDVYRRILPAELSFIRFALFVSFFPQLVAGPVVTAKEFIPQLNNYPEFNLHRMKLAARWFLLGFIKKSVIADNVASVVDILYANPENFGFGGSWLGAFGFWVQVYCDFSGYSDMAWGTALFLGYHLPENFRMPYLSTSPSEHWRRWHISLMRWLRDYLYIPLGGNRVSPMRYRMNTMIVMFLAGFWHGANWTFVVWGIINGLLLIIDSYWKTWMDSILLRRYGPDPDQKKKNPLIPPQIRAIFSVTGFIYTTIVIVGFAPMFRAQTIGDSWVMIRRMFMIEQIPGPESVSPDIYKPILLGMFTIIVGQMLGKFIFDRKALRIDPPVWLEVAMYPVAFLILNQIMAVDTGAFIYFVF